MPLFATKRNQSLSSSIARAARSSPNLSASDEVAADLAGARMAHEMSLTEKIRAEAEALRNAERARNDPATGIGYAADVSGMSVPDTQRLYDATRGKLEQPSVADIDDADRVGAEARPFPTAEPVVPDATKRRARDALATIAANALATGKTNAEQLTRAGSHIQQDRLLAQSAEAPDVASQNTLVAAAKGALRYPYSSNINRETGELTDLGEASVDRQGALADLSAERADSEGSRRLLLSERAALAARSPGTGAGGLRIPGETDAQRRNREAIAARNKENQLKAQRERAENEFRMESRTNPALAGAKIGHHLGGNKYAIIKDGKHIGDYELP